MCVCGHLIHAVVWQDVCDGRGMCVKSLRLSETQTLPEKRRREPLHGPPHRELAR